MKNSTASSFKTLNSMPSVDYSSSYSVEDLSCSFGNLYAMIDRFESSSTNTSLGNDSFAVAANGSWPRTQQVEVGFDSIYDLVDEAGIEESMLVPSSLYCGNIWADDTWSYGGMTKSVNYGFGAPSTSNWPACGIMSQSSSVNPRKSSSLLNKKDFDGAALYPKSYFMTLKGSDIFDMAVHHKDSRRLQNMLPLNDSEITSKIFEVVVEFTFKVMIDQYGHHVFMKLIEICNDNQLGLIVAKITFQSRLFFEISIDRYGSKSIKKLIKVLEKSPLISLVMSTLCKEFYGLMTDKAGSYVILKCLDVLDSQTNESLYLVAIQHCIQLATHEKGCISLNNFITSMKGPRRDQLLDLISKHSVFLSQDPSGNYVVQHILGLHNPVFSEKICYMLKGHYIRLSLQKSSSHVVETCLESPGSDYVIDDLLKSNQLRQVAKDQYGNYVIQTALKVLKEANSSFYRELINKIEPHLHDLQTRFGKNVGNLVSNEVKANKI